MSFQFINSYLAEPQSLLIGGLTIILDPKFILYGFF